MSGKYVQYSKEGDTRPNQATELLSTEPKSKLVVRELKNGRRVLISGQPAEVVKNAPKVEEQSQSARLRREAAKKIFSGKSEAPVQPPQPYVNRGPYQVAPPKMPFPQAQTPKIYNEERYGSRTRRQEEKNLATPSRFKQDDRRRSRKEATSRKLSHMGCLSCGLLGIAGAAGGTLYTADQMMNVQWPAIEMPGSFLDDTNFIFGDEAESTPWAIETPRVDLQPYQVLPGESLSSIADKKGLTVEEILEHNKLPDPNNPHYLPEGYWLYLPMPRE